MGRCKLVLPQLIGHCHGLNVHEDVTVFPLDTTIGYWILLGPRRGAYSPPPPQLFTTASGCTGLKSGATALLRGDGAEQSAESDNNPHSRYAKKEGESDI